MQGALEEAVKSGSPAVAQSLVAAVQDAAELAGALPPSVRARELQARWPACRALWVCKATYRLYLMDLIALSALSFKENRISCLDLHRSVCCVTSPTSLTRRLLSPLNH